MYLFSPDGKRYLDFASGIGVSSLGHHHPALVDALKKQTDSLWHISNMYQMPSLERFADRLCEISFADKVFFGNSGAEAVETAFKITRKYHNEKGNADKYRIIYFSNAFHGRTLATLSASDRDPKVRADYEPFIDGFDKAIFNDLASVKALITPETGGILVEPVQGDGGIRPADDAFLKGLRTLADEHDLTLIFDEIQCGAGRTGTFFAHEHYGVEPDILTLAKGIGGGFPLAATLVRDAFAGGMTPGTHGSTYGSNPLAMAVGNAVLDVMLEKAFIPRIKDVSLSLFEGLEALKEEFPDVITEVRGRGLMVGLKVSPDKVKMVQLLRKRQLLTAPAADNVVRLLPPLIVEKEHISQALENIRDVCRECCPND
jgi:acetylornithine/N-succinyldiaminopimelate aminotransferase